MKVDFNELGVALNKVKGTIADNSQVESYTLICFRDKKIHTFDGVTGTITKSPLGDFHCCVPGKQFVTMVDTLKGREGEFELENGWLHVTSGNHKRKIPTQPHYDFPDIMPANAKRVGDPERLIEALKICRGSMVKKDEQFALYGVGLRGEYAYSTDGKRITRAWLGQAVEQSIVLNHKMVNQLIRLGTPDYLWVANRKLGATYLGAKTITLSLETSTSFPFGHLEEMFGKLYAPAKNLSVETPKELLAVVMRVMSAQKAEEGALHLKCSHGRLCVESDGEETGHAEEFLDGLKDLCFTVKIKGAALKSALKSLKPETIDFTDIVSGQRRMLVFRGEHFTHVCGLLA